MEGCLSYQLNYHLQQALQAILTQQQLEEEEEEEGATPAEPPQNEELSHVRHPSLLLRCLYECNLSNQALTRLPPAFFSPAFAPSLVRCTLANNRLAGTLPSAFNATRFASLRCLNLAGNRLEALPEEFAHLPALAHLSLANNRLRVLPEEFFRGLCNLRRCDLSNNLLCDLPPLPSTSCSSSSSSSAPVTITTSSKLEWCSLWRNPVAMGLPPSWRLYGMYAMGVLSFEGDDAEPEGEASEEENGEERRQTVETQKKKKKKQKREERYRQMLLRRPEESGVKELVRLCGEAVLRFSLVSDLPPLPKPLPFSCSSSATYKPHLCIYEDDQPFLLPVELKDMLREEAQLCHVCGLVYLEGREGEHRWPRLLRDHKLGLTWRLQCCSWRCAQTTALDSAIQFHEEEDAQQRTALPSV